MKIQDLKDNRNEIIAYLNEKSSDTPKVMSYMANSLNENSPVKNDYSTWVSLADDIIKMFSLEKKNINTLWGPGCKYSTQSEYQRGCLGGKWAVKSNWAV